MPDAAEFLRALVPHVQATVRRNPKPLLMVDESLDQAPVWRTAYGLVAAGLTWFPDEAWSSFYKRSDGQISIGHPPLRKHDRETLPPGQDPGPRARGMTWPDRWIVQSTLTGFLNHDKVVLLTGDMRMNRDGLPKTLREEVRPVLNELHMDRLSLLVIFNGQMPPVRELGHYCAEFARQVVVAPFAPGYAEVIV